MEYRKHRNKGKYGPENPPYLDAFHAVSVMKVLKQCLKIINPTMPRIYKMVKDVKNLARLCSKTFNFSLTMSWIITGLQPGIFGGRRGFLE